MAVGKVKLEVELPSELIEQFESLESARHQVTESVVMDLLRQGKLSQGKAAEVLGLSRLDLPEVMARHGLSEIMVDSEDLALDTARLDQALDGTLSGTDS